jgi:hypothetical protein
MRITARATQKYFILAKAIFEPLGAPFGWRRLAHVPACYAQHYVFCSQMDAPPPPSLSRAGSLTAGAPSPASAVFGRAAARLPEGFRTPFDELTDVVIFHDSVDAPIPSSVRDGSGLYDAVVREVLDVAGYRAEAAAATRWRPR